MFFREMFPLQTHVVSVRHFSIWKCNIVAHVHLPLRDLGAIHAHRSEQSVSQEIRVFGARCRLNHIAQKSIRLIAVKPPIPEPRYPVFRVGCCVHEGHVILAFPNQRSIWSPYEDIWIAKSSGMSTGIKDFGVSANLRVSFWVKVW